MPDKTLLQDRKILREQSELESFDEDHYMADFVEPECVEPYLSHDCEWDKITDADINLSGEETDLLKELPNKEYLLDENEIKTILYGIPDILFASCYNCRTTLGENTVESSWTINKLSSTLSWFEVQILLLNNSIINHLFINLFFQSFTSLNDVILSSVRRSLCYPLIRNWNLSMKVFEDVKKVIKLGKFFFMT